MPAKKIDVNTTRGFNEASAIAKLTDDEVRQIQQYVLENHGEASVHHAFPKYVMKSLAWHDFEVLFIEQRPSNQLTLVGLIHCTTPRPPTPPKSRSFLRKLLEKFLIAEIVHKTSDYLDDYFGELRITGVATTDEEHLNSHYVAGDWPVTLKKNKGVAQEFSNVPQWRILDVDGELNMRDAPLQISRLSYTKDECSLSLGQEHRRGKDQILDGEITQITSNPDQDIARVRFSSFFALVTAFSVSGVWSRQSISEIKRTNTFLILERSMNLKSHWTRENLELREFGRTDYLRSSIFASDTRFSTTTSGEKGSEFTLEGATQ